MPRLISQFRKIISKVIQTRPDYLPDTNNAMFCFYYDNLVHLSIDTYLCYMFSI